MYFNNILPICTAAALANTARAYSWVKAGTDIVIDPDKVKAYFASVEGIPDTDAAIAATNGAVMQTIMEAAEITGFDVGQQVPLVPDLHACPALTQDAIADMANQYGAANIGVMLSISDQSMQVWDTDVPASAGDPTPSSWGDHDTFIWDWDGFTPTSLVRVGTWGYWQKATWRWIMARTEEVWGLRWPQLDPAPTA